MKKSIQLSVSLAVLFTLAVAITRCKKHDPPQQMPACVLSILDTTRTQPVSEVLQYEFNGQTVYYLTSAYCDTCDVLYDSNCNVICHPGTSDGQCPDFFNKRKHEKLIWHK